MTNWNHKPPRENSPPTLGSKGKRPSQLDHSRTETKRRRLVSKSETSTRMHYRSLGSSNRFEAFGSSSRTRRNKRIRKSSSAECSRKWVFSSRDCLEYKDKVVVVSYNILGVENASKHPDLYSKVPPNFLEWDQRKMLIREEINIYSASILCLQEVDHFSDLDELFQTDGFKGVYKARTGEARDGCALFWKDNLFTLLHQENIEFRNFGLRDNVAQLCVLKMKHAQSDTDKRTHTSVTPSNRNQSIVVGNIHVLFNPNRGDIKLGQVRLFLENAYKLSQAWGGIPVVIAGDLNSVPQSALYEFLSSSKLDIRLHDRRKVSGQLEIPSRGGVFKSHFDNAARIPMSISRPLPYRWSNEESRLAAGSEGISHLQHHLNLCSAYLGIPGSSKTRDASGEPLVTSYHSKFMGTVDYIWHSQELVPVRVLETLPVNVLRKTGGLPSEKWGSDHLALVCELAFANDGKRT
ncbi:Carbon catabolite repressor protein 4-like 5 [Quillaja saponaria]|uniref:Carbon catabolite repressor protein 4-like 5 n=1 Tax=Quillaja saponaria TaxID=32244 RepID=A0AAD7M668_QUISA|nr:Carbon catabolite repressor protein 4-like 5 [Quillaja saponaria]